MIEAEEIVTMTTVPIRIRLKLIKIDGWHVDMVVLEGDLWLVATYGDCIEHGVCFHVLTT